MTQDEMEELELLRLRKKKAEAMAFSEPEQPATDVIESAGRQFARAASAGYADELNRALEEGGQALGVAGLGGPVRDIRLLDKEPTQQEIEQAGQQVLESDREKYKKDFEDNPITSGITYGLGALTSPANKLGGGLSFAKQGVIQGAVGGLGESEREGLEKLYDVGSSAAISGTLGKGLSLLPSATKSAGNYLQKEADKLFVKATGATGKEAEKFAKGAGQELRKRGIVKAFDNPEKIAERASAQIKQAESDIDSSLKALDLAGGEVSQDAIIASLEKKISDLKKNASQSSIVKRLRSIIDDIVETGESKISLSSAEETKRGFNEQARNWLDPDQGKAGKAAYLAYRDAVEEAASKVNPEILNTFKEAKKTYGLLNPIKDAATKRASQLNQSPFGGLLDAASVAGSGGLAEGLGLAALRRAAAPRLASTAAVGSDVLGRSLVGLSNVQRQAGLPTALIREVGAFNYTPEMAEQKYMESKQQKTPTQKAFEANEKRKLIKAK